MKYQQAQKCVVKLQTINIVAFVSLSLSDALCVLTGSKKNHSLLKYLPQS